MAKAYTTSDIRHMLRKKYAGDAYAVLEEVRSETGFSRRATRYADALVVGLWPSRGLHIEGMEIKVSRSDWLHELKKPEKAETIFQYCDFWWLVVADQAIVQDDLPRNWGLMAPVGGKLKVIVGATKLEPKPLDRRFVAAICRKSEEVIHQPDDLEKARHAGWSEGLAEGMENEKRASDFKLKREKERADAAVKVLEDFQAQTGIMQQIGRWNAAKIGQIVNLLLSETTVQRIVNEANNSLSAAKCLQSTAAGNIANIEALLTTLKEFQENPSAEPPAGR